MMKFISYYLYLLYDTLINFMNYTLNQLKIFLKIAELKSITKASESLHLTQPAVSIQLKNFQDQDNLPTMIYNTYPVFLYEQHQNTYSNHFE